MKKIKIIKLKVIKNQQSSYEILVTYEKRFLFNLIKLRYNDFIRVYNTNNIKRYKTYSEALIALDVVKKLGIINLKQGQYKFKIK